MTNAYVGSNQVVKIMMGNSLIWQLAPKIGFTVNRYILAQSTSESLATGNGALTSDWIPVLPSTNYRLNFSPSNRRRMQSKNASGVITYLGSQSGDTSADGFVVTTEPDATLIRVYFLTGYDPSKPVLISITRVH